MERLVSIGSFAKLCRLSIKALRHYDQVGVLKPAQVDLDSGCRYYRLGQLAQAEKIQLLRSIGFSLSEIGPLVQNDQLLDRNVLVKQGERLKAQAEALNASLSTVARLLADEPFRVAPCQVKDCAETRVLTVRRRV